MTIYIDCQLDTALKTLCLSKTEGATCIFKTDLHTSQAREEALLNADIIFGNPRPVERLEQAHRLKWLQLDSVGFALYRHVKTHAVITNLQDFFSEPCAETMLAGILSLYRGMDRFEQLKTRKEWVGHQIRPSLHLLLDKKVLILGAGHIGKRIAKLLKPFGCSIQFYARKKRQGVVTTAEAVEALIPSVDIIIGCLPGTEETEGFFTAKMLDLMRPTALFCNVGRGNLVADEQALAMALKTGKIAGAVLDVTAQEPLPPDHPFWDCPNTILSQHSGGGDVHELKRMLLFFLKNWERFKSGQALLNRVHLKRGY